MKTAVLSAISLWQDTCSFLSQFDDIETLYCIFPFSLNEGCKHYELPNFPLNIISVDESIRLYHDKKIDAVIVTHVFVNDYGLPLMNSIIRKLKISGVENIFLLLHYPDEQFHALRFYRLDPEKFFLDYLETHLVDGCNLNCRSCGHFASLFSKEDIYPIDEFRRDMCELSKKIDLAFLRMMGGEPFLVKNLDEYLDIAREYFPDTELVLVSNGLLIPQTPDKILNSIAENEIVVDVTQYQPTIKVKEKIIETLSTKNIFHCFGREVETFGTGMNTKMTSDVNKAMFACNSTRCHFLRHGKIYKCPADALKYRYDEAFPNVVKLPYSMPANIYAANLPEFLYYLLDNPIKMCETCAEEGREIPWSVQNNPTAEDWL